MGRWWLSTRTSCREHHTGPKWAALCWRVCTPSKLRCALAASASEELWSPPDEPSPVWPEPTQLLPSGKSQMQSACSGNHHLIKTTAAVHDLHQQWIAQSPLQAYTDPARDWVQTMTGWQWMGTCALTHENLRHEDEGRAWCVASTTNTLNTWPQHASNGCSWFGNLWKMWQHQIAVRQSTQACQSCDCMIRRNLEMCCSIILLEEMHICTKACSQDARYMA